MSDLQYKRTCNLIVSDAAGSGLDLSNLTINFAIKKTDGQSPNTASIKVYNLSDETAKQIQKEFTRVVLQAGYESNHGIVFDGNVKAVTLGRENVVDSYIDIQAADGDEGYNFSVVNATLSAGATQRDQIKETAKAMKQFGVAEGHVDDATDTPPLPRGKVMYGNARKYNRQSAQSTGCSWSIQNGRVQVVALKGVLPNTAVQLNSRSGLVGTPEQTSDGIKFRCLINPAIVVGGAIQINERDIQAAKLDDNASGQPDSAEKKEPVEITADGFYRVVSLDIAGNSRGNDWYIDGVCVPLGDTPDGKKVTGNG